MKPYIRPIDSVPALPLSQDRNRICNGQWQYFEDVPPQWSSYWWQHNFHIFIGRELAVVESQEYTYWFVA